MKRCQNSKEVAVALGLSSKRGGLAELKADLTKEISKALEVNSLTHQELAERSGVPRSAITGIINGSLQKVTIDRLIRLLFSLDKNIEIKIKRAS